MNEKIETSKTTHLVYRRTFIDRNSAKDARETIEGFIPDEQSRKSCLNFLHEMILYSNSIDSTNWNLNLDKDGWFLRFNTGQEICIAIDFEFIHVLCLKNVLEKALDRFISDDDFVETTYTLKKVPGSISYKISQKSFKKYLSIIHEACLKFIDIAIRKTKIHTNSKAAHSTGAIAYLSEYLKKKTPNPAYIADEIVSEKNPKDLIDETEFQREQEKTIEKARRLSDAELERKILKAPETPAKVPVVTTQYNRDPYISELVKRKAKGICQDCRQPAPFLTKNANLPYLETHHIIPLKDGGKDSMENVIALCPNCHRKRHYG